MSGLAARIHAEAAGNPLYVVEMVRALRDQDRLDRFAGAGTDAGPISATGKAVVASRLARCSTAAREFLSAAVIFPRGAQFELVRLVAGLRRPAALRALDELLRLEIVREAPSEEVVFGHDLIRRAVEDSLSAARRRALHDRALAGLGEMSGRGGVEPPAELVGARSSSTGASTWGSGATSRRPPPISRRPYP